ncbi:MAG: rhodanese-like domain-containing protein [Ginsengibacter sp.]
MKNISLMISSVFLVLLISCNNTSAQLPENWSSSQLLEPSELAALIRSNTDLPIIFSVGPSAVIPGSIDIGMTNDDKNMDKLKNKLSALPKSANIVVYCGCCPFDHCPNVRPAIGYLKSQKFTNYHLLNLPHNIKTDWITPGYPVIE